VIDESEAQMEKSPTRENWSTWRKPSTNVIFPARNRT